MTNKEKILVIGNGMVGQMFLQNLLETNQAQNFEITVLCEEPRAAYDRVQLSSYFSGKTAQDLSLVSDDFFAQNNINLLLNCKVSEIDRSAKTVKTHNGEVLNYHKLVLATGSTPFVPPVEGHDRDHCHVYRTIEDLEAIKASAKNSKVGVVVGGGLLGLEAAKALKDLGLQTHVVEFSPRLMALQLDDAGAGLLKNKIEGLGVTVHTHKNTQNITDGDACIHKMAFADGEVIETDLIIWAAGIRPQDALARQSELELGPNGGIKINTLCQSGDPDIYAIGECAARAGIVFGLVAPGYAMAKVAAQSITQTGYAQFKGADMSTKLKLLGVDVASIGDVHALTEGAICYSYLDGAKGLYKKIVVSANQKRLLGAVLVGDASEYVNLLQMMLNKKELPGQPESLILPTLNDAVDVSKDELADSAQVCACRDVSKGTICKAIKAGAKTITDLQSATKASTGCGGCGDLVQETLDSELAKQPVVAKPKKVFDPEAVTDSTKICYCHNVTKGSIVHAVKTGAESLDDVKQDTCASTGCGACTEKVSKIIDNELEKQKLENEAKGSESQDKVCFCFNVNKEVIVKSVKEGANNLAAVQAATQASTGCGGCTDTVVAIMEAELEKLPETIS